MRALKAIAIAVAACVPWAAALAADMPLKAPPIMPFSAAGYGWYIGAGTEGGVASSSVNGSTFPSLTSGGLAADGAAVGVDVGYIWTNCLLSTWCQLELDVKYQNISGANGIGSVDSRWSISEEWDVGAEVFNTLFAAVGNLGVNFPAFDPTGLLPSSKAVSLAATPRQYFGFVLDEIQMGGNIGSVSGESWAIAPGVTSGWRWQVLNPDGSSKDASLKVFAKIEWPTRGVGLSGVLAQPGGAPLQVTGTASMETLYLAGIHYDFGVAGR
jgi:hypothetical protein